MQKKTSLKILFALLAPLLFCSCQDDDDNSLILEPDFFKYGETDFQPFTHGVINSIKEDESYDLDVFLLGANISFDQNTGQYSGIGEGIRFKFTSSEPRVLEGTYKLDPVTLTPETFYLGMVAVNYNMSKDLPEEDGFFRFVTSGLLEVEKEGKNYIFTFDLWDDSGKRVTGRYEGDLVMN